MIHQAIATAIPTRSPIVMRFGPLRPAQLALFETHRIRQGAGANHVDRTIANRLLIGTETWAQEALDLIERAKQQNHLIETTTLLKRRRNRDLDAAIARGTRDPWDERAHAPMREVIITAHQDWFSGVRDPGTVIPDNLIKDSQAPASKKERPLNAREKAFERVALAWLQENFGDDVIHARADLDEAAYHIHAVILPARKMLKRPKGQAEAVAPIQGEDLFTHAGQPCKVQLVPSKHPLLRNYEIAQDSVGLAFSAFGLARGKRHRDAMRTVLTNGNPVPERAYHVKPRTYRLKQEALLCHKIMLAEEVEQRQEETGNQQVETAVQQAEAATQQTETAKQQEQTRKQQDRRGRQLANDYTWLKVEADRQADEKIHIKAREKEAAEKINAAKAILSIAAAVSSGQLDPSLADLDQALRAGRVDATTEAAIDRSRTIAAQAYGLLGRAYTATRKMALKDLRGSLEAVDKIVDAWRNLRARGKALVDIGKLPRDSFEKLMGTVPRTDQELLNEAPSDARRIRRTLDDDQER